MIENPKQKKALSIIIKALPKTQKLKLIKQLNILEKFTSHKMYGSFWQDPEKKAVALEKMITTRQATAKSKYTYKLISRSTGEESFINTIDELSILTGYKKHSIGCFFSRGEGTYYFEINNDVVKVERIRNDTSKQFKKNV